jgi:hypothetical protein
MDLARFEIYFSYSQFMVYDGSVRLPGCAWTPAHTKQGFARQASTVNFRSLLEFGDARVRVSLGEAEGFEHCDRVIAVPFEVNAGFVLVEGPEEERDEGRRVVLAPGAYELTCAQQATGDEMEDISLNFAPRTVLPAKSRVLRADPQLEVPPELLESATTA